MAPTEGSSLKLGCERGDASSSALFDVREVKDDIAEGRRQTELSCASDLGDANESTPRATAASARASGGVRVGLPE
eukprot:1626052-Prymnesium_polylepis.1